MVPLARRGSEPEVASANLNLLHSPSNAQALTLATYTDLKMSESEETVEDNRTTAPSAWSQSSKNHKQFVGKYRKTYRTNIGNISGKYRGHIKNISDTYRENIANISDKYLETHREHIGQIS